MTSDNTRGSGRLGRYHPRLATIAVDHIQLPDDCPPGRLGAPRPLDIADDPALIAGLLRPPLVMPLVDPPGFYKAVGNIKMLEWQIQQASTRPHHDASVLAIVLPSLPAELLSHIPHLERYLVPLVLNELSMRKAASARQSLRKDGVAPPRPASAQTELRRLVKSEPAGLA